MRLWFKVSIGKENKFLGWFGDCIKVRFNSRRANGEANKEFVRFLSSELGIPQKMIHIISGNYSTKKLVDIPDNSYEILLSVVEPKQ